MKYLLARSDLYGYLSEIEDIHDKKAAVVNGKRLGQLANDFFGTIHSGSPAQGTEGPEDRKAIWVSLSFRVETDAASRSERQASLASLVSERNELVHHFFLKFDWSTTEEAGTAIVYLDRQPERALRAWEWIRSYVETLHEGSKTFSEYFTSDLFALRMSRVVRLLGDTAVQKTRSDNWTDLATAGQVLAREMPEEVAALKERFGQKTLRGLVMMTGMFEIRDEPTPKGGVRTLFRSKSEWSDQAG